MTACVTCIAHGVAIKIGPELIARSSLLRDLPDFTAPVHLPFEAETVILWKNYCLRDELSGSDSLALLQVSDFLCDDDTLQATAAHLASQLFPQPFQPITGHCNDGVHIDRMSAATMLLSLPEHLALAVIHAIRPKYDLQELLFFLPPEAHPLALSVFTSAGSNDTRLTAEIRESSTLHSVLSALPLLPAAPELVLDLRLTSPALLTQLPEDLRLRLCKLRLETCEDIDEAASSLSTLSFLTHLHLSPTFLGESTSSLLQALSSLHHLQHLHMGPEYAISARKGSILAKSLLPLSRLTHLCLADNNWEGNGPSALEAFVPHLTSLRSLNLSTVTYPHNFDAVGRETFCMANLSCLSGLTELRLAHNDFSDDGALFEQLTALTALQLLDLSNAQEPERQNGAQSLSRSLPCLTALRVLLLENLCTDALLMGAVALACSSLTCVTELDLSSNGMQPQALASSFPNLPNLCTLKLSEIDLGDEGASALFPTHLPTPPLFHLELWGNRITAAGWQTLAPTLSSFTLLTHLNLSCNPAQKEGALALATIFHRLPSLRCLHLSCMGIGPAEVTCIADKLTALTNLTALDLGTNRFGDTGAAALAPTLQGLAQLRRLQLFSAAMGDCGVAALVPALAHLTQLTNLDLRYNPVTDASVELLLPLVWELPLLSVLSVSHNRSAITEDGKRKLAAAVEKNRHEVKAWVLRDGPVMLR